MIAYKIAISTNSAALRKLKIIFKFMADGFEPKNPKTGSKEMIENAIIKIAGIK